LNVGTLGRQFEGGAIVSRSVLVASGLVPEGRRKVKILGDGELAVPLTIKGMAVSKSAREKIEKAGGKIES